MMILKASVIAALGATAAAYDLPDNLRRIYDQHRVSRPKPLYAYLHVIVIGY